MDQGGRPAATISEEGMRPGCSYGPQLFKTVSDGCAPAARKSSSPYAMHLDGHVVLGAAVVRILLVEDHTDTRIVLSRLLTHYGYGVSAAENVHDALVLLASVRFDILLSDIGLPDGNGLELVGEARKLQPLRTTVALTALATDEDRARGLRAGFDHYLTKPLDAGRLRSLLAAA